MRVAHPRRKPDPAVGPLLAALGDETRQDIIERLRAGPRTVGELADSLPVSRPAVSQHLKVLRDAGVVTETRRGVRHYFALDTGALDDLRRHFERLWQDVMLSFANYVKERESGRKGK
jgi:DNA-binding transcriptional ArsR family regulator